MSVMQQEKEVMVSRVKVRAGRNAESELFTCGLFNASLHVVHRLITASLFAHHVMLKSCCASPVIDTQTYRCLQQLNST